MADGFNTEDMLDMYLFENQQLLEKLQETVLEQKDEECFERERWVFGKRCLSMIFWNEILKLHDVFNFHKICIFQ